MSDTAESIIPDCEMYSYVLVKMWSVRVNMLRVVLVGPLVGPSNKTQYIF